jgi:hypothetical protein
MFSTILSAGLESGLLRRLPGAQVTALERARERVRALHWFGPDAVSIGRYDGGFCAVAVQFTEIRAPRLVDQLGVIAEALEKPFNVGGVGAEFLGDNLR